MITGEIEQDRSGWPSSWVSNPDLVAADPANRGAGVVHLPHESLCLTLCEAGEYSAP